MKLTSVVMRSCFPGNTPFSGCYEKLRIGRRESEGGGGRTLSPHDLAVYWQFFIRWVRMHCIKCCISACNRWNIPPIS